MKLKRRAWICALLIAACSDPPEASLGSNAGADGGAGSAGTSSGGSGGASGTSSTTGCEAGRYVGEYTCVTPPIGGGPVTFDLIPTTGMRDPSCSEFCTDLVINPATGHLRGSWTFAIFEGDLVGGLDCTSGEFRADLANGTYGVANADGGLLPLGTVTLSLDGTYEAGAPAQIAGTWVIDADAAGDSCTASFEARRQP